MITIGELNLARANLGAVIQLNRWLLKSLICNNTSLNKSDEYQDHVLSGTTILCSKR
ncbi:hypothetical protein IM538_14785 [Cytobacillus suaedae]|nr:hypothetical protein IM538_14785 [Cytobacillus suaedae]